MARTLLTTKEVAKLLGINDKMVYGLIAEKGLPATKVTGKWLFPVHLVEQWIESQTINYPKLPDVGTFRDNLLILAGSNDILLDKTLSFFNKLYPDHLAVFANVGSLGGLKSLRAGLCHIASSHLMQENGEDYNFGFAQREFSELPAIVNFCRREQGLLVAKHNPKGMNNFSDLGQPGIKIVNRPLGTGTRLLFDSELRKVGIQGDQLDGYDREFDRHLDVGLEILSGRADVGLGIAAVAGLLDLDFLPIRWERFDLLISKDVFFSRVVQLFLNLVHDKQLFDVAANLQGYDLCECGRIVFPKESSDRSSLGK
ncbi:MAG: helix-turn-helix transcriptional regulator [Deltaproteobacteria bacterium]|nr:helix-turn-helix transcriptional regulator [Deltaproteobacteria bacterium]